ncbi:hypothetical protein H0H81_001288 [Sphagnurus paluster]|uniref:Protein kinase domain-containing protein n=1 Tax=Sphagnurus paluster TaxID=117069 RepID=A0A9P7FPV3_9AGAR|nr:hypothetical protein H0H81_001288 [Sphagnurus paluster]
MGRCTRIWCVYEEFAGVEKKELAAKHQLDDMQLIFVGPYALKLYTANIHTESYTQEIFKKFADRNIPYLLLPKKVWYLGKILDIVRYWGEEENTTREIVLKDREEIIKISDLKRTLDQFLTPYEFYGAIIGVLKGIEALAEVGIMHRDISPGNIVLDDELVNPQRILNDKNKTGKAIFLRRSPVKIGAMGGLHDLEMAASVPSSVSARHRFTFNAKAAAETKKNTTKDPRLDFRTGTTPYMSIPVLIGWQHSAYCDAPIRDPYQWPQEIRSWADSSGTSLHTLGDKKSGFFEARDSWAEIAESCLDYWSALNGPSKKKGLGLPHVDMLSALRSTLWRTDSITENPFPNTKVKPSEVIEAMEKALEDNKHRLGWVSPSGDENSRI